MVHKNKNKCHILSRTYYYYYYCYYHFEIVP